MKAMNTAVITGTTSGIGEELALQLAKRQWNLVLVNRSRPKAEALIDLIDLRYPDVKVSSHIADLADQDQVVAASRVIAEQHPRIDALFNNAGVLLKEASKSRQGHDLHFQVNVLAPQILTFGLRKSLAAAAATQGRAVVINASSNAVGMCGPLRIELLSQPKKFGVFGAYGQSKLALTVATASLAKDWAADKVHFYAVDPGGTQSAMTAGPAAPFFVRWMRRLLPTAEKSAAKILEFLDPKWEAHSGAFIMSGKIKAIPKKADSPESSKALDDLIAKALAS